MMHLSVRTDGTGPLAGPLERKERQTLLLCARPSLGLALHVRAAPRTPCAVCARARAVSVAVGMSKPISSTDHGPVLEGSAVEASEGGSEARGSPDRARSSPPKAGESTARSGHPVGGRGGPYSGTPRAASARAGRPPALEAPQGLPTVVSESAAGTAGAGRKIRSAGKMSTEAYAGRNAEWSARVLGAGKTENFEPVDSSPAAGPGQCGW